MEAGAGEDKNLRRWRVAVTVAAWLLITQAALSTIGGLVGILLASTADAAVILGQLGPTVDRSSIAVFETLLRQAVLLNRVHTVSSVALLVGSIGLLLRKKWGWHTVVVVHVAVEGAVFIWGLPMLEALYRFLDPRNAGAMALAMSILASLAPASVVVFLLLKPVVTQFQKQGSGIPGV